MPRPNVPIVRDRRPRNAIWRKFAVRWRTGPMSGGEAAGRHSGVTIDASPRTSPAPRRRRAARPARPGPARRRHGAPGACALHRAGRERQDDDPGRPGGLARGHAGPTRRRSRRSPSTRVPPRSCGSGWRPRSSRSASPPDAVRVRTFHALGLEILRDAGRAPTLVPRERVLREVVPDVRPRDSSAPRRRLLPAEARPRRDGRGGRPRPGARPGRPRLHRLRAGARVGRRASTSTTSSRARSGRSRATRACWPAGAPAARTCWSTRSRTSTEASFDSPSCWPRRRTGSSSSATTTRASTAGDSPTCAGCWGSPPTCPACGASTSPSTTAARRPSSRARSAWSSTTRSASRSAIRPGPGASGRLILAPAPVGADPCRACSPRGRPTGRAAPCWREPGASCSRPWPPAWPAGSRSGPTACRCRWRTRAWTASSRRRHRHRPSFPIAARVVAASRAGRA